MKAIETVYHGWRFRSRLEARWAVFFDALHIPYMYEPEGYDLDGVWYLPDFWLPEQHCWVEIKAQAPTKDEKEKAKLLAWHTGKDAYIFYGDVWLPGLVVGFSAIRVSVKTYDDEVVRSVSLPYELSSLLRRLDQDLDVTLAYTADDKKLRVIPKSNERLSFPGSLDTALEEMKRHIRHLEWQMQELPPLMEQIESRKQELVACVAPVIPMNKMIQFQAYSSYDDPVAPYWWMVCRKCKKPHICNEFLVHQCCSCFDECENDEELLLAGFTAARQARFEHRKGNRGKKRVTKGEADE